MMGHIKRIQVAKGEIEKRKERKTLWRQSKASKDFHKIR